MKLSETQDLPPVEKTGEYAEGRRACRGGALDTDNPYVQSGGFSNGRYCWCVGWLDERSKQRASEREERRARKLEEAAA